MSLQSYLHRLQQQGAESRRLGPAPDRSAIPAGQSVGQADTPESTDTSTSGGITWPLTEQPDVRTYHDERTLESSDGMFVIVYRPLKSAQFANSESSGVINYNDEPLT